MPTRRSIVDGSELRPWTSLVVAGLAVLLGAACGGGSGSNGDPSPMGLADGSVLQVEIGFGDTQFGPIRDGDRLPVTRATAPQSGAQQHLWTAVRIAGRTLGAVRVRTLLEAADGSVPLAPALVEAAQLRPSATAEFGEAAGLRTFVAVTSPDRLVRMRIEVTAGADRGSDTRLVYVY